MYRKNNIRFVKVNDKNNCTIRKVNIIGKNPYEEDGKPYLFDSYRIAKIQLKAHSKVKNNTKKRY